jgi:hypothetical protein
VRKLAREAAIFCLVGSVLTIFGTFVVMERSDRAAGSAAAMSAVHGTQGGWIEIRVSSGPPDAKLEPSINFVKVPLTNRTVLSVRQCPDLSQKVLPGLRPYNPIYEQEHACRSFFYPVAKDGGELVSVPLGNPDQVSIEKDYWDAYKAARRNTTLENLLSAGLRGFIFGFPAGFGVWCLYRLVQFAIFG